MTKEQIKKYVIQSENLINTNKIAEARQILAEILTKYDDENIDAANNYAVTEIMLGNYGEAEDLLNQILIKDPGNKIAIENMGYIKPKKNNNSVSSSNINNFKHNENLIENSNLLKILFIQDSPCIRNYKYAAALRKKGHKVTLAYFYKKLSERYYGMSDSVYNESIKITSYKQLWDLAKNYDIIHSHNEPDQFTVLALGSDIPVIHDTHDLISLREPENQSLQYFEGIANRAADGRIYSTPYQQQEAATLYGVEGPSLVFYNYASKEHLPKNFLPKLSASDGKIHFVYEGGVSGSGGKHRNFTDQFIELANYGVMVHIYPASYDQKLAALFSKYPNIEYNRPVMPESLIELMTQYDFGLIPWNLIEGNERFLASTIANKLFEYLAAGLPVATANIKSYRDFFSNNPVGLTFNSIEDLTKKLNDLFEIKKRVIYDKPVYTYENEIIRLEEFYNKIIAKNNGNATEVLSTSKNDRNFNDRYLNQIDEKTNVAEKALRKLTNWIDYNGWSGYDPYDAEDLIIQQRKTGNPFNKNIEHQIRSLNSIDPLKLRTQLDIKKKINSKAMGLLLSAYVDLYTLKENKDYLEKALEVADWLLQNSSSKSKKYCWGYPFDWQSIVFIPKDTPSVVVSKVVGDGFWKLFQSTNDKKYLDVCESVCRFITEDLNIDEFDNNRLCFSYTPIDNYHVHNSNLFAAEFLIKIGKEIDNKKYITLGKKAANYALSEQNENGSIFYWGTDQDHNNSKHLDSYHCGFEIRMLHSIYELTAEKKYKLAAESYFDFFLNTFVKPDGSVLQFLPEKSPSQINIHGLAEAILVISKFIPKRPGLKKHAEKIISWTVDNLQHSDGWFGFMVKENQKIMVPYLRWGDAWMMRGLSDFLLNINNKKTINKSLNYIKQNQKKEIVFVRKNPQMRFYKIAWALKKKYPDYRLILAANKIDFQLYKNVFDEFFQYKDNLELSNFITRKNPLLYYTKAGPNIDSSIVIEKSNSPVIYDAYDFTGLRYGVNAIDKNEAEAEKYSLENSTAIVTKFPNYILNYYKNNLGYKIKQPYLTYLDYCIPDLYAENKFKLEGIHLVYTGVLNPSFYPKEKYGNNQYFDLVEKVVKQNIFYHIYVNKWQISKNRSDYTDYLELSNNNRFFEFHNSLPQKSLQNDISQYTFGISLHDFSITNHLDLFGKTSIGNKLSTYLEAGLPTIISSNLEYNTSIVKELDVGFGINLSDLQNLSEVLSEKNISKLTENVFKVRDNEMSAEKNVPKLIEFINQYVLK